MSARMLPVLDVTAAHRSAPVLDQELAEFATDDLALPSFHVWTLGCQMNHSDSEEMAGALLAAGCAEADSLESAELRHSPSIATLRKYAKALGYRVQIRFIKKERRPASRSSSRSAKPSVRRSA